MLRKRRQHRRKEAAKSEALSAELLRENAILSHVPASDVKRVVDAGESVTMPTRHVIYEADTVIDDVYFPIDCVLSIVTEMDNGESIEVGTIGREGTSAIPMLLGGTTTANRCYCQVPGRAIKMPAKEFHRLMDATGFRSILDRYLQAYVNFLGQLTACNRLHTIYERTARWLLLTHDRVDDETIVLTHEYLAMMLGSRRSGVSIALSALQNAGFIEYAHGKITILNRAGLMDTSCECYAVAQRQFAGFLGPVRDGNRKR